MTLPCKGCETGLPFDKDGHHMESFRGQEGQFFVLTECTKERTVTETKSDDDELDEAGAYRAVAVALQRALAEREVEIAELRAHRLELHVKLDQAEESLRKALAREEWIWGNCDVRWSGSLFETKENIESKMPEDLKP